MIPIYTKNEKRRKIDEVYYVPGLKCNLISVGQLMEKKYRVFFKNKVCTIYDKYPSKQLISRVEMTKNIMFFLIMINKLTDSLNSYKAKGLNESLLWNFRYGHLHLRMVNCNPVVTPIVIGTKLSKKDEGSNVDPTLYKRLVGSLVYLTTRRLDIMFVVSLISIFMESPKNTHWHARKRILWYVVGTTNYGVLYTSYLDFKLIGYIDSDFAGCVDDKKNTSGYVFNFELGAVAWVSKKQSIVTLSSDEEE